MYTAEEVLASIRSAVERFPDRVNPRDLDDKTCVYTSPHDPEHHCIAGQVLVDLDLPVPQPGDARNNHSISEILFTTGLSDEFDHNAAIWLAIAQGYFDSPDKNWRACLDELEYGEGLN